jgi:hypothetical protein
LASVDSCSMVRTNCSLSSILRQISIGELYFIGLEFFSLLLFHYIVGSSSGGESYDGVESSIKKEISSSVVSVGTNGAFSSLRRILSQCTPWNQGCFFISSLLLKPNLFLGFFSNSRLRRSLRGPLLINSKGGLPLLIFLIVIVMSSLWQKKGGNPAFISKMSEAKLHQSDS